MSTDQPPIEQVAKLRALAKRGRFDNLVPLRVGQLVEGDGSVRFIQILDNHPEPLGVEVSDAFERCVKARYERLKDDEEIVVLPQVQQTRAAAFWQQPKAQQSVKVPVFVSNEPKSSPQLAAVWRRLVGAWSFSANEVAIRRFLEARMNIVTQVMKPSKPVLPGEPEEIVIWFRAHGCCVDLRPTDQLALAQALALRRAARKSSDVSLVALATVSATHKHASVRGALSWLGVQLQDLYGVPLVVLEAKEPEEESSLLALWTRHRESRLVLTSKAPAGATAVSKSTALASKVCVCPLVEFDSDSLSDPLDDFEAFFSRARHAASPAGEPPAPAIELPPLVAKRWPLSAPASAPPPPFDAGRSAEELSQEEEPEMWMRIRCGALAPARAARLAQRAWPAARAAALLRALRWRERCEDAASVVAPLSSPPAAMSSPVFPGDLEGANTPDERFNALQTRLKAARHLGPAETYEWHRRALPMCLSPEDAETTCVALWEKATGLSAAPDVRALFDVSL